jgi:hypothetical protein
MSAGRRTVRVLERLPKTVTWPRPQTGAVQQPQQDAVAMAGLARQQGVDVGLDEDAFRELVMDGLPLLAGGCVH